MTQETIMTRVHRMIFTHIPCPLCVIVLVFLAQHLVLMRILAITYHNIGPFTKPISIVLKQGCFLIKAPVGRGKSFLFFDGIVYALYKKSHRSMLNATAKS